MFKKIWSYITGVITFIATTFAIILYHRRAADRDTATNNDNKSISKRTQTAVNRAQQAANRISEIITEVKKSK